MKKNIKQWLLAGVGATLLASSLSVSAADLSADQVLQQVVALNESKP